MKKVITYGTYDLLHYGHIKLLERAKKLGDYLIVGVTSDDYDKSRGKINVQQSLTERIEAVRALNIADQIIVEEYEGQKIDDINRYDIDIFTVGSDWKGYFDYLNEYCQVVYLDRTEGISSSKIRSENRSIKLGMVGDDYDFLNKFQAEDVFVNGVEIVGICTNNIKQCSGNIKKLPIVTNKYEELLKNVDAVYIKSDYHQHYNYIKTALNNKKDVLCESPVDLNVNKCKELFELAKKNNCILMEAIRTAYSMAYYRLLLLVKARVIGDVISVESTCTSIRNKKMINSLFDWGGNALLPIFQILGTDYKNKTIISKFVDEEKKQDGYTQIDFVYKNSTAKIKVAERAKSDGSLIITGTKGYIYVPAPWWKTDYFEIRFENQDNNKRYFYPLDGEGIRYELVAFVRNIVDGRNKNIYIDKNITLEICKIMEDFENNVDIIKI